MESDFQYPHDKLKCPQDNSRIPVVLLGCGSFNPVSIMHLRLFSMLSLSLPLNSLDMAKDALQLDNNYEVLGGYLSPVSDGTFLFKQISYRQ
jgi:nicotinamide mononucleotide adenylyltransferase